MKQLFTKFIWNNRRSRLRLSLLYLPYERGGLQLPNLQWYFWAAQIRAAMHWFSPEPYLPWVQTESACSKDLRLDTYLYSAPVKKLKRSTDNPFVRNTINVWHKVQSFLGESNLFSGFSPIWGNDNFSPGRKDQGFKLWATKGICKVMDLYKEGKLVSFEELRNEYDIPQTHFFKYLQLRSFVYARTHSYTQPPLSILENLAVNNCTGKGQISLIYNILVKNHKDSTEHRKTQWVNDLQKDITKEEWREVCLKVQHLTINTHLRLIQYNWIMRTYITPVRLHKLNPNIPDTCIKCNIEKGTLLHCLWECPEIRKFWTEVIKCISQITLNPVPDCPTLCILNLYPKDCMLNNKEKKITDLCLVQARRLISLCWKDVQSPTIGRWLKELSACLVLEKLTYIMKKKLAKFKEIWNPFLAFLKNCEIEETVT